MIDNATDKAILFAHVVPDPYFEAGDGALAVVARLRCLFPHPGRYTVEVRFFQEQGSDILKAEVPFSVVTEGD